MRSAYFLQVRRIVNVVDPIGLIDLGAPEDEYDLEIEGSCEVANPVTAGRVGWGFRREVGEDIPLEQAEAIAAGVAALEHAGS